MGMSNSAQSFQRLADAVIGDLPNTFCYLDDILVHNSSEEEHQKTLNELFKRLANAGLALSLDKCEFGKSSLDFLGYTIDKDGIRPINKKIEALDKFPVPQKQKEVL